MGIEEDGDKNMERSVSVRKRMQDEIKKEKDEKSDKLDIKEEKSEAEEPNINTHDSLELLKLKGESLRRKDRQYRSSKDDLNTSEREGSKEERRREHRSGSRTLEKEDDKGERRKRDDRQRERDKKERERNEKIREEDEERRRRTKEEKRKGWRNVIGRIVKRGKLRRRRENVLK